MTDRKKDLLAMALLLALLIAFFAKILFTDKIIRAPDIINEFYWTVKDASTMSVFDQFRFDLRADWNLFENAGDTTEGGWIAQQFLLHKRLLFNLLPAPASVAWFIVLHLFFGGAGAYFFCRVIGASRPASFLGGLIFAIAPENASLINAGHVLKIATISFAPWAFFLYEKASRTGRLFFFLATSVALAFQFFHGHWQIAYYTCLALAVYALGRLVFTARDKDGEGPGLPKQIGLNLVTVFFFLTTVAISLAPLASWSVDTNRGAQSGSNQGKGGLNLDEAMSWSLPPEELATFVVPGLFGFSRQEAGENPSNISSYYWGRMVFTQTTDYMGLLPWLLLPLPLIFRRDKYTWLALAAVAGGLLFSMGKYTLFYRLLFDYFPGINRFRVPKMIMFIPVFGLGALAARGLDILLDEEARKSRAFRRYLYCVMALPVLLVALLGAELAGRDRWIAMLLDLLAQPTRYEQGPQLVMQRWNTMVTETGMATFVAAAHALALFAFSRSWLPVRLLPGLLLVIYLADTGRVNAKFMFLVNPPHRDKGEKSQTVSYLQSVLGDSRQYRVMPMNGSDPMIYASNGIPVMFTSRPVQQRRWQEYLDAFSFSSAMPDMVNVRYLIHSPQQYAQDRQHLGDKFVPVFTSRDGGEIVLENRQVLPKGWLVPSAIVVTDYQQALGILQNPGFDPRRLALVENAPPLELARPDTLIQLPPSEVKINRYEGEKVDLTARASVNSLLVLGDKHYKGWRASVDGKEAAIYPVNHILRGVYLTPGEHKVEFRFDPPAFKIGKYLTLASFVLFALFAGWELLVRRRVKERG